MVWSRSEQPADERDTKPDPDRRTTDDARKQPPSRSKTGLGLRAFLAGNGAGDGGHVFPGLVVTGPDQDESKYSFHSATTLEGKCLTSG